MTDWERLVKDHGPAVFGTAWRILGHAADAEEVVQEVFLEALRVQRAQHVERWPGLLRRLAACRALDRLRQRQRSRCLALDDGLPEFGPGPEAAAVGRELADRLRREVARLPQREGAVFCLRYFEDLSNQQIARALDISIGAVATALHKARAKLEAVLLEPVKGE